MDDRHSHLRHSQPELAALLAVIPERLVRPLQQYLRTTGLHTVLAHRAEYHAAVRRNIVCGAPTLCMTVPACGGPPPPSVSAGPAYAPPVITAPSGPPPVGPAGDITTGPACIPDTLHHGTLGERRAAWVPVLRTSFPGLSPGQRATFAAIIGNEQGFRAAVPLTGTDGMAGCNRAPIALELGFRTDRPHGAVTWTTWRDTASREYLLANNMVDVVPGASGDSPPATWRSPWRNYYRNEPDVHRFASDVMTREMAPLMRYFSIGSTNRYWPELYKLWGAAFWSRLRTRYVTTGHIAEVTAFIEYLGINPPEFHNAAATTQWLAKQVGNTTASPAYYTLITPHANAYLTAEQEAQS